MEDEKVTCRHCGCVYFKERVHGEIDMDDFGNLEEVYYLKCPLCGCKRFISKTECFDIFKRYGKRN